MMRDVRFVEFKTGKSELQEEERNRRNREMDYRAEIGKPVIVMICGTLIYYHCAYRNSTLLTLVSDVLIVLLCSLAILGLLFRQINISVPVDPLEWQISQDTANNIVACMANTIGAAESVLRVAATGHDKRLFVKVVVCLYVLSALGRVVSGVTVAYAGLWLFCLYMFAENSQTICACMSRFMRRRDNI
ncbi:hypothetical protein AAG906_030653 [Vitis piasezkii]|uniref:Reticulon domain-containing protein n=2 Tax=Vitis vinifera TaxID=29760 RepID=A0ABY9CKP3_VITVI|nr:reticulon-like protein B23 isoform X1 [Vitis vinifera]WJZ95654.1 hypothetical protein VitviT2T_014407 [Vitis vinifera]|eukprot:XP_002266544.2 PREDICTED: reticulon-like protein B23 isoform X2 [Vitis vinifera]